MTITAAPELFAPTAQDGARQGFSSRDALRLFFKHKWIIVTATLVVTALVWAGLKVQPKVYDGSAKVWIKTDQQAMPTFLTGIAGYRDNQAPDPVNRRMETEMELMRSRDNAERVIDRLQIQPQQLRRAPMLAIREQLAPVLAPLKTWLGRSAPAADDANAQANAQALSRQQLVDEFLTAFTVAPQHSKGSDTTSNVIEVRFTATDPDLIPQVIQAMLDEYLQLAAQQNRRLGETTLALLESKAREAREELRVSEQQLLSFSSSPGGRAARSAGSGAAADAGGGSMVGQLKTQALDLQRRMDELRQVYTEEAENVKSMARAIDQLQGRIRNEVRATAEAEAQSSTLERQHALAQERFVELRKRMDQIDLYLRVNPTEAESRVLTERPTRPLLPDSKRQDLLKLLAPLIGLLLGLTLAGLREMLDRRLQTAEEVERFLGQPVLAALPTLSARRGAADDFLEEPAADGAASAADVTLAGDESGLPPPEQAARGRPLDALFADPKGTPAQLREAATRDLLMHGLAQQVRDRLGASASRSVAASTTTPVGAMHGRATAGGRILLVTSARPGEGKSCLARALAKRLSVQDGGSVLLIDANAQSPAGHGGDGKGAGFFDLLRDKDAHARVVPNRAFKRMHMLPAGRRRDANQLFHEPALAELFERTRSKYAWTVIDAGVLPLTGGLSAFADGVIVVVDATSTRREVVQGSLVSARLPVGRLLGVVLNRRPQYVPSWLYRGWL